MLIQRSMEKLRSQLKPAIFVFDFFFFLYSFSFGSLQNCDRCSASFLFQIDKQFGYFPKDAVQEEEVHATMEKVVETQVNTL